MSIPDSPTLALTQHLFQLIHRLPHLSLRVRPIDDLTKSEHELLIVLRMNTTSARSMLSASEITRLLHITPAGGTHLFKSLEKAGYIRRCPDPRDRRIALIGLTEQGLQTTADLLDQVQEQIHGLIEYLGETNSQAFIQLLSRVFDYLSPELE